MATGGPDYFTNYALRLDAAWGMQYRRGRYFHKLAGIPTLANAGLKFIDNGFLRHHLLAATYKDAQGPQHTY